MANDDRIATDHLVAARDAYYELGKALETGVRRPDIAKLVTEDGLDAYDQRLMVLRWGLREALAGWCTLAENEGVSMTFTDAEAARADKLAELAKEP